MKKISPVESLEKFRQSNHITKARYDYSIHEKRIIYHTIMALQNKSGNAAITEDMFNEHLEVFIPMETLKKTDQNDNISRDYQKACETLRRRDIKIKGNTDKKWVVCGFINYAMFDYRKGLTVEVSKFVVPYLADLSRGYTSLSTFAVFTLKSKYSQRFYEWCCQWRKPPEGSLFGWFEFTPEQLNETLELDMPNKWLKQHVIDPARKEIMEMFEKSECEVCFDYTEERGGRGRGGQIYKWKFKVITNARADKKSEEFEKLSYPKVYTLLNLAWGENNRDMAAKIYDELLRKELITDFASRVDDILNDHENGKIKNLGGYVRSTVKDRYGIEIQLSNGRKERK